MQRLIPLCGDKAVGISGAVSYGYIGKRIGKKISDSRCGEGRR